MSICILNRYFSIGKLNLTVLRNLSGESSTQNNEEKWKLKDIYIQKQKGSWCIYGVDITRKYSQQV